MSKVAPAPYAFIIDNMDTFTAIGPLTTHPSAFTGSRGLLAALADLLKQSNGFAMWRGALVVLPSGQADGLPTIESYNDGAWKRSYDEDVHDTTFFALDSDAKMQKMDPTKGQNP